MATAKPTIDDRDPLRGVEIDAYAHEAHLAGASDEEVAGLKETLKGQARKGAKVRKIREQIAAMRTKNLKPYFVQGPGFLLLGGERHASGDEVELTPLEAAEMGAVVATAKPVPPPPPAEKREAGRYRVDGPGSVFSDGRIQGPGSILTLSRDEARSLVGVNLTPVQQDEAAKSA